MRCAGPAPGGGPRRIRWALLAGLTLAAWPGPELAAQQPAPADTVRLSPEELLRAAQLRRLDRLNRLPGSDTLDNPPLDSLPAGRPPGALRPGITPPPLADGDTLVQRLLSAFPGYQPVQYEAATARFQANSRDLFLVADTLKKVTVVYEGRQVTADSSIEYNQLQGRVEARGQPVATDPGGEPVTSRLLRVDTRTQQASAYGAETRVNEGAVWSVYGDLPSIRADMVHASHARFTSCTLEVPHFHFAADRVKIVRGSILVAAPVTLRFADVPVLWVPFIAQSLSQGRASGLLTPRFSINDVVRSSGGYARRISNVGFYWAMSDYTDATVALDWFSGNFTALTGSLRYRYAPGFLSGGVSARQFWREEGGTELSLNGNHSWQISERTNMNASVAFVSSAAFVRRNTFDPLETTQQITSSGGITRRFDWGQLNLLGNRSQSLSDDRVDMTLPRATLSLKPITLFQAPVNRASWYHNMTWSGGANVSRRSLDFPDQPADEPFRFQRLDQLQEQGSANHSLSIGNLSFSQSVGFQQGSFIGVPRDSLPFYPGTPLGLVDIRQTSLDWSSGLSYQQNLIGTTSITPNISISGSALRSDTVEVAQRFVSAPARLSFGANLQSQIFGFFPGFGPFEALRHRLSPSFNYQWSPEVEPSPLQRQVFGSRTLQPRNQITVGLSQTFEARRRPPPEREPVAPGGLPAGVPAGLPALPDSAAELAGEPQTPVLGPLTPGAPLRRPQGQTVTLLSLLTSAVAYDFVQADSTGQFSQGFTTTRLRNEIQSDYLRGLSLSFEHELFRDSLLAVGEGPTRIQRAFDPHLSSVNLRFAVSARSSFLRWLGIAPSQEGEDGEVVDELDAEDPFARRRSVTDDASILPGQAPPPQAVARQDGPRRRRDWNATFSYALVRPRDETGFQEASQNLRMALTAQPTDLWTMAWRTSYDLEGGRFSDHMVTFTRDMHEWQAHFDFLKTATGNWAFRFEVTLLDLPDLHFDFDQRSVEGDGRLPPG